MSHTHQPVHTHTHTHKRTHTYTLTLRLYTTFTILNTSPSTWSLFHPLAHTRHSCHGIELPTATSCWSKNAHQSGLGTPLNSQRRIQPSSWRQIQPRSNPGWRRAVNDQHPNQVNRWTTADRWKPTPPPNTALYRPLLGQTSQAADIRCHGRTNCCCCCCCC